jgi:hypothetical protein
MSLRRVLFLTGLLWLFSAGCGGAQTSLKGEWVFPIWFQDALGRRDTLNFILDKHASVPFVDVDYGEIPYKILSNKFQAFIRANVSGVVDTGKVWAYPTNQQGFSQTINMLNYKPPLKLKWNSKLLTKTNLNLIFEDAKLHTSSICVRPLGEVDMTAQDSIILYRFDCNTISLELKGEPKVSVPDKELKKYNFAIYPSPVTVGSFFNLLTTELSGDLVYVKLQGVNAINTHILAVDDSNYPIYRLLVEDMPSGTYCAEVRTTKSTNYLKVIVQRP